MSTRDTGTLARLRLEGTEETPVAVLEGEVDLSNAAWLAAELGRAVGPAAAGLVLDLSLAEYIDSAGIHSLFEVTGRLEQRRQRLALAVPAGSSLRPILEATGVPAAIPMERDVAKAIAAVHIR